MQSLVLLVLLVAVAAAQVYHGYPAYRYASPYYKSHAYYRHGYPYAAHGYGYVYRGKRDAEAEPQPEAEAEAEPGTTLYSGVPYPYYAPYYHVAPKVVKVKSDVKVPAVPVTYTYPTYSPYYLPYAGAYGHHAYPYAYHPYVVKPVAEEAEEPAAATSEEDEAVEVSRKRREAEPEAEAEADPATKVVAHHVAGYPYAYPLTYTHVAPKVVKTLKTYTVPASTYSYPYYSGYYGHPGYVYGK
jgi:hypothetical protein